MKSEKQQDLNFEKDNLITTDEIVAKINNNCLQKTISTITLNDLRMISERKHIKKGLIKNIAEILKEKHNILMVTKDENKYYLINTNII
jgi:uncharacterized Zn ribbon protein